MSLEQFTDLSYKPWMKIDANTVNATSFAVINNSNVVVLKPAQSMPIAVGGAVTHPFQPSVSFPGGVPTISYNEMSYFSANGASQGITAGTAPLGFTGAPTVTGINYTSFDNTYVTIAISGYYKIDYGGGLFITTGSNFSYLQLGIAVEFAGVVLNCTNSNPTFGALAIGNSSQISNSGIVKLLAGNRVSLYYTASFATYAGPSNIGGMYMNLLLVDSVSA